MLFHCIYTSVQTSLLAGTDITQLVRHSREANAKRDITGVLLHVENTFFQVLEGSAEAIDKLYEQILVDPRHTSITRIIYESIPRRYFSDCSMSLTTLSRDELSRLLETPGSHDPSHDRSHVHELLLAGLDEGRAKRLLQAFSDGRWRAKTSATSATSTPPARTLSEGTPA